MLPLVQVHLMDWLVWEGCCATQDQPEPGVAEQGLLSTLASACLTTQLSFPAPSHLRAMAGWKVQGGKYRDMEERSHHHRMASVFKNAKGID